MKDIAELDDNEGFWKNFDFIWISWILDTNINVFLFLLTETIICNSFDKIFSFFTYPF